MEDTREQAVLHRGLYLIAFPVGHLANDWAGAALWLLAPAIALSMDLNPGEVGLLIAVYAFGASIAYVPAGLLGDLVRQRGWLMVGTFWWVVIGFLAASLAPGFWVLCVLLAIGGMGSAAWHPIATGVLVQNMPGRRAQVLGVHAVGGSLAEVLAPLLAGFLLVAFDWREVLQISAIPAVVMGLVFIRLARVVPVSETRRVSREDLAHLWDVWRTRSGIRIMAVVVAYNMSLMAIMSMMPLLMQTNFEFSASETGTLFAVMLLSGTLLQPVLGRISDDYGRRGVIVICVSVAACCSLAVALMANPWLVSSALVVGTALLVGVRAAVLAGMVEVAGRSESTALGLAFAIMDGVGALGALLGGLAGSYDLTFAFVFAALAAMTSVLLTLRGLHVTPAHRPAG